MNASSSSLELAARLAPQRASRSARRLRTAAISDVDAIALGPPAPTTTTIAPPVTVAVRAAVAPTAARATTNTTARKRTTTTTARKPRPTTTTTTKPAPRPASPPEMRPYNPPAAGQSTGQSEIGQASWYKAPEATMCAHKTLPMGTIVTVVNVANNKSTTCKIGDRGPYIEGRIIDLSPESFNALAPLSEGVIDVRIEW